MTQNSEFRIQNSELVIEVEGGDAVMQHGGRMVRMDLKQQPILSRIEMVLRDSRRIKAIKVQLDNATFSITRQVVAVVNTLAWQLGVKVNGKEQLQAVYSGKPNITKPRT